MATSNAPELIFGCGGLGTEFIGVDATKELLHTLKEAGVKRVDTAGLYPPTNIRASQRLLGQAGAAQQGFTIDTKVLISMRRIKGSCEPEKIATSVTESRDVLNFGENQRIHVYYPHAADSVTPLKDQAYGFDRQYKKGMFDRVSKHLHFRHLGSPNSSNS